MKWPAKLTGTIPLASWLNAVLDSARSTQIKNGVGYKVRQSMDGVILEIQGAKAVGNTNPVGSINYRGLWSATPSSPYMTFDVVQLGSGTSAGMYLSTADNNIYQPDTGVNWTQISSSTGTWL